MTDQIETDVRLYYDSRFERDGCVRSVSSADAASIETDLLSSSETFKRWSNNLETLPYSPLE